MEEYKEMEFYMYRNKKNGDNVNDTDIQNVDNSNVYRYFVLNEKDIENYLAEWNRKMGYWEEEVAKLKNKYGIEDFILFRNSSRVQRMMIRYGEAPDMECKDLVICVKKDTPMLDGFTEAGCSLIAEENISDFKFYKVDLRTKAGKQIFEEFMALEPMARLQCRKSEFVANSVGLWQRCVKNYSSKTGEGIGLYNTVSIRKETSMGPVWLFAVPVYNPVYVSKNKDPESERGLRQGYKIPPFIKEITAEEYLKIRAEGN